MLPAADLFRYMWVPENADEGSVLRAGRPRVLGDDEPVPVEPPEFVSLDDLVDPSTDWRCDGCGQKWGGRDVACGYCGCERED